MLSTKDLVFKERSVKKLTERYVRSYLVEEVVLKNIVKLKLLVFLRSYLMVNISEIVRYRNPVKEQRMEKSKPVKINRVEEWEVEKNTE